MVHVYTKKRNANDNNPVLPLVLRLQLPYNVNQKILECLPMQITNYQQAMCNTVNLYLHKNLKNYVTQCHSVCYLTVNCTVMIAVLAIYVNTFFCRTKYKIWATSLLVKLMYCKISCQCDVNALCNRVQ